MKTENLISHKVLRTVLFAIFLINGFFYIPSQSITVDEGDHYNYAVRFVKGHPEKTKPFDDASTMPLSAVNTIPRVVEQLLTPGIIKSDNGASDLIHGRYFTLFVSAFIGLIVYRWARVMYSNNAALAALFLFAFCPNINAHASLVTTDAFSALFTILPAYYLWKFCRSGITADFFWFACWLATAQLAKQSLTWLYPIFMLTGIMYIVASAAWKRINFTQTVYCFAILITVTLVILNVGFQLKETGKPLSNYAFKSSFFTALQGRLTVVGDTPLPLPSPYLYGLDYTKNMDEMGGGHPESSGDIYLLGESRSGKGFYFYYLVIGFFKTPIPLLIGVFLSITLLVKSGPKRFLANELFILVPVLLFVFYFNVFYKSQVGLRHVLMIYPLLIVFAVKVFEIEIWRWQSRLVMGALACWSVASFYFYFPLLIPYTNEFLNDKKLAYRVMADSNLDYGNAVYYLRRYLASHPKVSYAPKQPNPGQFVIRTTDLLDLNNVHQYQWLRANFKPVGHVAFTYLLFDISSSQLKKHHLIN